jgi:hypothetical protein
MPKCSINPWQALSLAWYGAGPVPSVVNQKSLYFVCHSGLDLACPVRYTGESSVFELDSRFRGNDSLRS